MSPVRYITVVSPADPDDVELSIEPSGRHPDFGRFQARMVDPGMPWTAFAVDDIDADPARLTALGVAFRGRPTDMGPVRTATLDDT